MHIWLKEANRCFAPDRRSALCLYCPTPLNTSSLIFSGHVTRPSESRNSSHLSRGGPLVTSGLGPSSTPLMKKQKVKINNTLFIPSIFAQMSFLDLSLTQVMSSNPGSSSDWGGKLGSWGARVWAGDSGGRRAALKKFVTLENPPNVVAYGSWINLCLRWNRKRTIMKMKGQSFKYHLCQQLQLI